MFAAEHIEWSYPDGYQALRDIDLNIARTESVGLVGANGAGKSTLLRLFAGIIPVTTGRISVDGMAYTPANLLRLRQKIGYVFQNPDDQVFMPTVYDDVAFGIRNFGHDEAFVEKKVTAILARLGIAELRNQLTHKLSGGQKRSVALAGVLVMNPDVIFLDEPTAFLDLKGRRSFINLMQAAENAKLLATHDLELVLELCPRVLVMDRGRIVADGPVAEVFSDKKFMESVSLEVPPRLQNN